MRVAFAYYLDGITIGELMSQQQVQLVSQNQDNMQMQHALLSDSIKVNCQL
jgi:hypothetical protein